MRRRLGAEAEVNFFGYDDLNSSMNTFGISIYFEGEMRDGAFNMGLNRQRDAIHMMVRDHIAEVGRRA